MKQILPYINTLIYQYGFNGQEKDDEVSGAGNTMTAEYWEYDARLGRRYNIDPVTKPWQSSYSTFSGNPISNVDINGDDDGKSDLLARSSDVPPTLSSELGGQRAVKMQTVGDGVASTHTDENGNVISVKNDKDNGVYKHKGVGVAALKEMEKNYSSTNTSAGGTNMGETEFWDEFINPDTHQPDGTILFGERESWEPLIKWANTYANNQDLSKTMEESKRNQKLDIKTGLWASEGVMTGRLLNGKYVTARSAGNFLAGMNGVTGTFQGGHISGETYMKLAGAYQVLGKLPKTIAANIVLTGKSYAPAPYYGEESYSGRQILKGIEAGNKLLGK